MKSVIINMIAAASLMVAGGVLAMDMPELAKKNGCTSCHAIEKKIIGPAWMDISKKYKGATKYKLGGKEYPLVEGLMMKVSKGGSGNWGAVPMTANDPEGKKQGQIRELIQFELSLAK